MNFDSSQTQGAPNSSTMYFNLTPGLTVPQDATNVTVNCANASLWNSVPNCEGKVIEAKIDIFRTSWNKINYDDGSLSPPPPVLISQPVNFAIPTGRYSTDSLSDVLTSLLFERFEFTDANRSTMLNPLLDGGLPVKSASLISIRNVLMLQEIIRALKVRLVSVTGANRLRLEIEWNKSEHEGSDIWAAYINEDEWGPLKDDILSGESKMYGAFGPNTWQTDEFQKLPTGFALAYLLRFVQIEFNVGPFSVLREPCGFDQAIAITMGEATSSSPVIKGSVEGKRVPNFDKLQYFLISCTLAASGISLNGKTHNGVIARIHIPAGTEVYDQILYEPYSTQEFQTSGLEHNLSGISSIAFTLLDQNGNPVVSTGGQSWSVLLRIAWS